MTWLKQLAAELHAAKAEQQSLKELLLDSNRKAEELASGRKRLNGQMEETQQLLDQNYRYMCENETAQDDLENKLLEIERTIELHAFLL
jgi:hypothetical protein